MVPLLLLLGGLHGATAAADYTKVTWATPTAEPSKNTKGQPVISGGMPVGNGETAVLAFPIVPQAPPAPAPAPGPAPAPQCKSGALVGGKYCDMGAFIGCHDSSCQINGEESCKATTKPACVAAAAKACDANAACVAFSLMGTAPGHYIWGKSANVAEFRLKLWRTFAYLLLANSAKLCTTELAKTTSAVLKGFPDSDWTYYVSAKPCVILASFHDF